MRWKSGRWVVVPNPGPAGSSLSDVTISSATDVWATGTARSGPFVMHWDGSTWSIVERPGFGQGAFASVALIPGTTQVWIYGDDEASYGLAAARSTASGWEKFLLPVKGAGWSTTSRSLVADTPTSAWIAISVNNDAGVNHPVTFNWDGTTWKPVDTPNPGGNASLTGIAAAKASDIWTVGIPDKRPERTHKAFIRPPLGRLEMVDRRRLQACRPRETGGPARICRRRGNTRRRTGMGIRDDARRIPLLKRSAIFYRRARP
jgi:hypothetical protein